MTIRSHVAFCAALVFALSYATPHSARADGLDNGDGDAEWSAEKPCITRHGTVEACSTTTVPAEGAKKSEAE